MLDEWLESPILGVRAVGERRAYSKDPRVTLQFFVLPIDVSVVDSS